MRAWLSGSLYGVCSILDPSLCGLCQGGREQSVSPPQWHLVSFLRSVHACSLRCCGPEPATHPTLTDQAGPWRVSGAV